MTRILPLLALLALPATASAADCVQNTAAYTEKDNGYVLSFRPTLPWEGAANTMAVMDLAFPDGTHLWGTVWLPNGTSHDRARLYTPDCTLPVFDPAKDTDPTKGSSEEELAACTVWDGPLLGLADNDIEALLWHDGAPPRQTLLLPDLGPTIRYSDFVLSPGDEPHDVFTLTGCPG